ncbi:hypothetical protein HY968_02125 [Candidatus Kaiserbacteria bacterium]|nr:hypothetical protein [Candidatus Kaiserbacteria bacterium]
MDKEPAPLTEKQRQRIVGVIRNLVSGGSARSETSKAVQRHLRELNFKYPIMVIFSSKKNKSEDRVQARDENHFLDLLRYGPEADGLKDSSTDMVPEMILHRLSYPRRPHEFIVNVELDSSD